MMSSYPSAERPDPDALSRARPRAGCRLIRTQPWIAYTRGDAVSCDIRFLALPSPPSATKPSTSIPPTQPLEQPPPSFLLIQSKTKTQNLKYKISTNFFTLEASPIDGAFTFDRSAKWRRPYTGLNRFDDGGDCGDEYNYCSPAYTRRSVQKCTIYKSHPPLWRPSICV